AIFKLPSGYNAFPYEYGIWYYAQKGVAFAPGQPVGGKPDEIAEYYALYMAYANFLDQTATSLSSMMNWAPTYNNIGIVYKLRFNAVGAVAPGQPKGPIAPSAAEQAADPGSYLIYLNQYQKYLTDSVRFLNQNGKFPLVDIPAAPAVQPVAVITTPTISLPAVADNSPSPTPVANNPIPLQSASLAGGTSSSFRVVAGADLGSTNPLALQPLTMEGATRGKSVIFD
ncbi:hypothetical protein, partial [Serratia marcescens]